MFVLATLSMQALVFVSQREYLTATNPLNTVSHRERNARKLSVYDVYPEQGRHNSHHLH